MRNTFESVVGTVVLVLSLLFLFQFLRINNIKIANQNQNLNAKFKDITGISVGTDIRISGVKVGSVKKIIFDEKDMQANVQISIRNDIKIPQDSFIAVSSNGIFGSKFLSIMPGFESEYIPENGIFENTKSSLNLEDLVSKFASSK